MNLISEMSLSKVKINKKTSTFCFSLDWIEIIIDGTKINKSEDKKNHVCLYVAVKK